MNGGEMNNKKDFLLEFGNKIKSRRIELDISQDELAEKIGYTSKSTISKIESGKTDVARDKVVEIAHALQVSPAYLMGWEEEQSCYNSRIKFEGMYSSNNTKEFLPKQKAIKTFKIPLYNCIACGEMTFLDEDIIDYISFPDTILNPNNEYFANYAKGNSMIDRGIKDGNLLFFQKTNTLENGQIGSFCYQNNATCKVYRKTDKGIILMPANSDYDPIFVDDENFRIIGKLVYILSKEEWRISNKLDFYEFGRSPCKLPTV